MTDEAVAQYQTVVPYLYCTDAAALAAWLERVLGFETLRQFPDETGLIRNVELRVGACEVWLDHKPQARESLRGVSDWIGVFVESVEAVERKARLAGVSPTAKMDRPWGVRELQITDPEGYCWGFLERIA
ncbi:hypothetical protein HT136_17150 [Novosphingobium profundi]|uniref:VOC family protein n=1 Tax=Novosphingobium profundi TaxID=1774954 RepID=UPI001BDA496D|nr:VOC family protein [Novosphingobium profundi]MBT0670096.1 hypothetical protein [Novosphingobium profundi]